MQQEIGVPLLQKNTSNYFNVLTVEEIPDSSVDEKDTPKETELPTMLLRRPKWERRLPEKLEIDAAEPGSSSLYLWVEIENMETQRKRFERPSPGLCQNVRTSLLGRRVRKTSEPQTVDRKSVV